MTSGDYYIYVVHPRPSQTYSLEFDLLKGFDRGHRSAHFHLPQPSHMRRVELTLDLSRYVAARFDISRTPAFYVHTSEPESHDFCDLRGVGRCEAPREVRDSVWRWAVEDLDGGVVDVCWDHVAPPGFIELSGPATADGLELIADRALEHLECLQYFYLIGNRCLVHHDGVFVINRMARLLRIESKTLGRRLSDVSGLFRDFFRAYGHPPDRAPFVPLGDMEDGPTDLKIIDRIVAGPQICEPVGRWAWELTRAFLEGRRLIPRE